NPKGAVVVDARILVLLIVSALGHAVWNSIARRVEDRETFLTLIIGVAVVLYAPMAVALWHAEPLQVGAWKWVGVSTVFEILYLWTLGKSYRLAPLTIVYPVARGTSPLVTTLLSVLLMGAVLGGIGVSGIVLSVFGILFINSPRFSLSEMWRSFAQAGPGLRWALLTGVFTACYTVSDGMGAQMTSGFLFKYIVMIGMFLGKWVIDRQTKGKVSYIAILKRHPIASLVAGVLVFGANSVAVYAMQSTSVAYVAAVREMSIVFASLIGLIWLKEKISTVKWVSIVLIVCGVVLIKLG
ncbi:MAG: EamA family transporter, partial [Tumebacillaceae bacterium]